MKKIIQTPLIALFTFIGSFTATAMEEIDPVKLALDLTLSSGNILTEPFDPDGTPPASTEKLIRNHVEIENVLTGGFIDEETVLQAARFLKENQELKTPNGLARALHKRYGVPEGFSPDYWLVIATQVCNESPEEIGVSLEGTEDILQTVARQTRRSLDDEFAIRAKHELGTSYGFSEEKQIRAFNHILLGDDLNPSNIE
jgi:hypothetical protein